MFSRLHKVLDLKGEVRCAYREEIVCEFRILLKDSADLIRAAVRAFALRIGTVYI